MSEATKNATTLNLPSRRGIAAGGLAMLALAAAAATGDSMAPPGPDAELVALAAEFVRLQRLIDPLTKRFFELSEKDPELEVVGQKEIALGDEQDEITYRMRDIPAVTAIGLQAKAEVARRLYLRYRKEEIRADCLDHEDDFAWAMINDILGGAVSWTA